MKQFILIFIMAVVLASCSTKAKVTSSSADYSTYTEDLSGNLPDYPDFRSTLSASQNISVSSSQSIDSQLASISKAIKGENEKTPYFNGFTVLIYSGVDREAAFKAQEDLEMYYPDMVHRMQYEQPRYLLKVGQYIYRIEAQKNYSEVKELFPTARIIQDKLLREDFKIPETEENVEGEN